MNRNIYEGYRWLVILLDIFLLDTSHFWIKVVLIVLNFINLLLTLTVLKILPEEHRYFPQRIYYGSIFSSIFGMIIYTYLIYNP